MKPIQVECQIPDECKVVRIIHLSRVGPPDGESYIDVRVYLRPIEPDEVKLAKEFKAFFSGKGGFDVAEVASLTEICDRIIAKHEANQ